MEETMQARTFILGKFKEQGDFDIIPEDVFEKMLDRVIALDEEYVASCGVDADGVCDYDDDAAFEFMHEKMMAEFPDHKMYMMRLVDDYLEYNEAYLDSVGALEWAD
ncbi:MAG: hypothetical protein Q4C53_03240 [Clostridia bacterium]|nr:hypothetical protein [Clostridia bacterium]